jgi:type I restriction enzyme S subunit
MNTRGNEKFMHHSSVALTDEEAAQLRINVQPAGTIIFPKRGGAIATNKKRILVKPSAYDLNTVGIFPSGLTQITFGTGLRRLIWEL